MDIISIESTEFTPKVVLDHTSCLFEIKGESSPEDARAFYAPLIKWVDDFGKYLHFLNSSSSKEKKYSLVFTFHFDYVTSSSLKNIYDLLQKIASLKAYSQTLLVKWMYDAGDDDMRENGVEFSKLLSIPFEIVST